MAEAYAVLTVFKLIARVGTGAMWEPRMLVVAR